MKNFKRDKLKKIWGDYKIILWGYVVVVLLYIFFFIFLKNKTICYLNSLFEDNSFGVSFSASLFEDICFFGFIGILSIGVQAVTSLRLSSEDPFDDRVRSLMNSKKVEGNDKVFYFLRKNLIELLAFNSRLILEIKILDFFEIDFGETKKYVFEFKVIRTQIFTNMCNDEKSKIGKYNINIESDYKINDSYGRINLLAIVDPNKHDDIQTRVIDFGHKNFLKPGNNPLQLDIAVDKDKEIGYKLDYNFYCELGINPSDILNWFYFEATKYAAYFKVIVTNQLRNGQDLSLTYKLLDTNNNNKIAEESMELLNGGVKEYNFFDGILAGEQFKFHCKIIRSDIL